MTPKEKARELVEKMDEYVGRYRDYKQCALICVDEILSICTQHSFNVFWNEVKHEINKL